MDEQARWLVPLAPLGTALLLIRLRSLAQRTGANMLRRELGILLGLWPLLTLVLTLMFFMMRYSRNWRVVEFLSYIPHTGFGFLWILPAYIVQSVQGNVHWVNRPAAWFSVLDGFMGLWFMVLCVRIGVLFSRDAAFAEEEIRIAAWREMRSAADRDRAGIRKSNPK